tara:strand:- start:149 stop:1384 length:1236 start_codon:yes stop_codon:yes gene_type:complete
MVKMDNKFTLSDVIKVPGDGNCFFHALKVGLDNIFSQHPKAKKVIDDITDKTLRQNIVNILLEKINVPIEKFKKITIPIPGVKKNEQWSLASYHGVDIDAGDDVYEMAKNQLITHLNNMKSDGIYATDLEVFGAQLYFQELMNTVGKIEELQKLGEIKIGIYTPPRTNPIFLEGNEGDRSENDAVIRIINVSGYTVNGWHFDALPSTDFDGNLKGEITADRQEEQISAAQIDIHFEILKKEMIKIKDEINENKTNYVLIDQLTKNKEILIDELINLRLRALGIEDVDKTLTIKMEEYLNEQLKNSKLSNINNQRNINVDGIKAGIGLKLELPLSTKLGITKHCCEEGGGMKKKHKRKTTKTTKRTKRQKDKNGRKWSKKYKDSINCKKPKGFSQRQHCLTKSKKRKIAKKN